MTLGRVCWRSLNDPGTYLGVESGAKGEAKINFPVFRWADLCRRLKCHLAMKRKPPRRQGGNSIFCNGTTERRTNMQTQFASTIAKKASSVRSTFFFGARAHDLFMCASRKCSRFLATLKAEQRQHLRHIVALKSHSRAHFEGRKFSPFPTCVGLPSDFTASPS